MAREKGSGSFRKITRSGKELWEYRIEGKSFYAATKKDCRDKYQNWKSDSHESKIEKIVLFKDWAIEWLQAYKYHKVADGTYKNYELYVTKHIVPFFADYKIKDIRPALVEKFMTTKDNLSNSARHHIWIALNNIFETAVKNRLCEENPCTEYKPPREEKDKAAKIKFFAREPLEILIKYAANIENGYYVLLPLYTGLRLGELAGLKWEDINGDIITISRSVAKSEYGGWTLKAPKSGKRRFIGITNNLSEVLNKIPKRGQYVLSDGAENFLTLNQIETRYAKVFKEINKILIESNCEPIEYLSIHKCRHTYATYLADGGAAAKDIQELLGHSSISTTQIYFHVDQEAIRNASNKLSY